MFKRLQHLYWKLCVFGKNCLTALIFIAFFGFFFTASAFGFWLKIQFANWLFG